jgi:hypothetical protein
MWAGCALAGREIGGLGGAIVAVLLSMALWGIFGTPGDGSRGEPMVPTPGRIRLLLEIALFGIAAWGFWVGWDRIASETFLTVSVLHYVITWERQWWLIRGGPLPEVG